MPKGFRGGVHVSIRTTSGGKVHVITTISKDNSSKTSAKTIGPKKA